MIDGTGNYILTEIPRPVHGTLWIESDGQVTARVVRREFEEPLEKSVMSDEKTMAPHPRWFQVNRPWIDSRVEPTPREEPLIYQALSGRKVSLFLKEDLPNLSGTLVFAGPKGTHDPFLHLVSGKDRYVVNASMVAMIKADEPPPDKGLVIKRERAVLLLQVNSSGPVTVRINYLCRGLSWAPSYRLDLGADGRLVLVQKAVIRNEWRDLENAHLELITGFPNIEFADVLSPLSPDTTWADFLKRIADRRPHDPKPLANVFSQAVIVTPEADPFPINPTGEGRDMHYQEIGPVTLARGESIVRKTGSGTASYERYVEWSVTDRRNPDGSPIHRRNLYTTPETPEPVDIWDGIRFRNPLSFPMTTAPALILENNRPVGQTTSTWTPPSGQAGLLLTRALGIINSDTERVEEGERRTTRLLGRTYRREKISGSLVVGHMRPEPVNLVIKKRFSGNLLQADGEPVVELLEEGVLHINQRNQLTWNLVLEPGETKTISYQYELLVRD
ncbi:MAG: hypothetical protein QNK37_02280 [Acidobacteriota bacterium]|nr:hypothetical protein [Acidobacteriota bacterium]